jgi:putative glycosyltransferase (TIGR04372 family)
MKNKIKIFIHYLIALFDIIVKVLLIRNKSKICFFLNTEGGFGPSITRSHLLNTLHGDNWILFFGTKKKRHNKKITKIFDEKLKFFPCGDLNFVQNKEKFEKFVSRILLLFFAIKITNVETIILDLEFNENDLSLDEPQKKYKKIHLFETGFFFKKIKDREFYENNFYKKNFLDIFEKYESNFNGRINFFLRGKGKKYPNNRFLDNIRDSRNIEDYKPTIEYLIENNWQVFLTGEMFEIPEWLKEKENSIIFHSKTNLEIDDYNLYAMSNADFFIGGSSGPPLFNCINNSCKTLILETKHIGISYLNCVVSYPKILTNDILELEEIFRKSPYDDFFLEKLYKERLVENLSKNDLKLITKEFIENININSHWKTFKDLGFTKSHAYYLDAKISNYWLKLNNIKV